MKISTAIYFFLLPLTLASTMAIGIKPRDYDAAENLALVDCGIGSLPNGGSTSRQMIYYSGDIWENPGPGSYTTNSPLFMVDVPWDGSYPWRSSGVTATTPNGDIWTVEINPAIKDPGWAGVVQHKYNDIGLICWSLHGFGIYTLSDGASCTTAYVCNHKNSPPITPSPLSPETTFSHNSEGNSVTLVGTWSIDDIFKEAKLHDGGNGAQYCDGLQVPHTLSGSGKRGNPDCTIAFDCGPDNSAMMVSVAKQVLEGSSIAYNTSTQQLDYCPVNVSCLSPEACFTVCDPGPDCYCDKESDSRAVTNLGSGFVVIDMLDGPNAAQSRLTYEVQCPTAQQAHDCAICQGMDLLNIGLDLVSFGIGGSAISFFCSLAGC